MKILLIDQDTSTLEKLQISLTRAGYTVFVAADGSTGMRLAQREHPDLIVLDILLSDTDGLDLCEQLRQDPVIKNIPRFLVTALSVPHASEPWKPTTNGEWHLLEYTAHHPKPLRINQFLRQVEHILHPSTATSTPTGPGILLVLQNDAQRDAIRQDLEAKNYNVRSYSGFFKPVANLRSYPPAALVIDEKNLTPTVRASLKTIRTQNSRFGLIVLQSQRSESPPPYIEETDCILPSTALHWQVVSTVENVVNHQKTKCQLQYLSKQLLDFNSELTEAKQAFLAQKKELEFVNRRLRELDEAKETLTGMVVHDLKAPLSAMLGALQFITMDPGNTITEGTRKIITGGLAAGFQMQRLTLTLLDEHKLENNQLILDIEPIPLLEILNVSLEMLNPLFNLHQVSVKVNVSPELPPVQADPIILQRIIENLLDNAVKYSPMNETISIMATHKDNMVEICVADRGEGIPPQYRDIIFDRFTQLDDAVVEKLRTGVGLGLTFCKLAVQSMGGEIWVDSLDNIGAAFHFTLPIAPPEEQQRLPL